MLSLFSEYEFGDDLLTIDLELIKNYFTLLTSHKLFLSIFV